MNPIDSLADRAKFWGEDGNHLAGSAEVAPYSKHLNVFRGASALEIGPGAGRQFDVLSKHTSSYDVADISSYVLEQSMYKDIPRHLITSYDQDLGKRFSAVSFWYVIHHVKPDELASFLKFAAKHVEPEGCMYFNTPDISHPDSKGSDGFGTTLHSTADIAVHLGALGFSVLDIELMNYECVNILARRVK